MSKITQFDRPTCQRVSTAIEAALRPLAQELGVVIKTGNGRYSIDGDNFTLKVEAAVIGENGAMTTDAKNYIDHQWSHRIKAELGTEFVKTDGERYAIVGYRPRSTKYPVLCKRLSDGKAFKFPVETVKRLTGQKDAA